MTELTPSLGHIGADGGARPKNLDANLRFGFLIHDISRLRRVVVDRALKPLGITRAQWWVLAFLSRRDGITQTALAGDLDLTKVAVGGLLDRIEASGFVERRADERDARARRVFLTRAGQRLVSNIRASVDDMETAILTKVSEIEIDQAAAVLVRIKDQLIEMLGSDPGRQEFSGFPDNRTEDGMQGLSGKAAFAARAISTPT